jgi:alkylation response protein AidB-like acyl-CoA dehydrogenase
MTAVEEGGHRRLHGRKQFITNGCATSASKPMRSEPGSQGLEGLSLPWCRAPRTGAITTSGAAGEEVRDPRLRHSRAGLRRLPVLSQGPRGLASQILHFMNEARWRAQAWHRRRPVRRARRAARADSGYRPPRDGGGHAARHAGRGGSCARWYRPTELQDRIVADRSGGPRKELALRRQPDRTPLVKWMGAERTCGWRTAVQVHGGYGVVHEYDVALLTRNALYPAHLRGHQRSRR